MKNVWETCTFSDEIISSDFNRAKFAVELHEFLDKTAGSVYQDPELFFENTFPTNQMKYLVKDSLIRLESGRGQPVTVINTGFGGGKTHSILLLHHIINNPEKGLEFIKKINLSSEYGIEKIPKAKMLALDCRKISKNTLWGEIADQLGQYDKFKEFDVEKKPINDISLIKSLFEQPTLLLIDELPHYLLKADGEKQGNRTMADLTIVFLMDLISAISASDKSCLILTLTDKQTLYEKYTSKIISGSKSIQDYVVDEIDDKLREGISRQTQIVTPVERNQIYDVVRARLVKKIDDTQRDIIVKEYFQYYQNNGIVLEPDFEEKLKRSYPFHPFLIDTLYDRVSTISKFNQTRGMLRLLGRVIRQITAEQPDCKIISLGDIQLTNHEIADELTAKIDMNLRTVIDTDCINHAQKLDESKSTKIVESIARTIYVFSLHGQNKKSGIRRNQIKLSVGRPGIEPALVDKSLEEDISENFWYIQDKDNQEFYFVQAPNINAIIFEHKKDVTSNEIRVEIGNSLKNLLPSKGFSPVVWDEHELDDTVNLKIFIIDYAKKLSTDAIAIDYMTQIIDRTSNGGIRTNKNTIVFVYVDQDSAYILEDQAKYLAAVKKTRKDETVCANESFLKQVSSKESNAKSQLENSCMTVYCKIGYPNGVHPRLDEIRFLESKKNTITESMIELLIKKGKLVEDISVDGIKIPETTQKISSIYKNFKEDKSQPFLLRSESIADAIKDGTGAGKFGFCNEIKMSDEKYIAEINKECFNWDGYIVNKDKIHIPDLPDKSHTSDTSIVTQQTFENVNSFKYQIDFESFTEISDCVFRLALVNLEDIWKNSQKQFNAKVNVSDTVIFIESKLNDYMMLKGVLNSIKEKNPSGTGYLIINSTVNMEEILNKNNINVKKV